MGDVWHGLGQQRQVLGHQGMGQHLGVARQGTNAQCVAVLLDLVQTRDAVDVDNPGRFEQSKRQHRHQALPAREHVGLVAVGGQGVQSFVKRAWAQVIEGSGFHGGGWR